MRFFGQNSSGIQMRDFCECLSKFQCDITLVTVSEQNKEVSYCDIVSFKKFFARKNYIYRLIDEIFYSISGVFRLIFCRKLSGYDIIVWYSPSIFWAPLIWILSITNPSASRLLILRDVFPDWAVDLGVLRKSFISNILGKIAHFQYQLAHRILIQSPGNVVYFENDRQLSRKVEYFPNWLKEIPPSQSQMDVSLKLPNKKKIIIYSGSLGVAQGYKTAERLIEFCCYSSKYGILFVGRGDYHNKLKDKFAKQMSVSFSSEVSENDVRNLYAKCDFGLVLLDPKHFSQNIPGKFIGYLRDNLPVLISVNLNNDLRKIVQINKLGVDVSFDLFNLKFSELEHRLDEYLYSSDRSSNCRNFFKKEYDVEKVCKNLLSIDNKLRKIQ